VPGPLTGELALVLGGTAPDGRHSIGAAMAHFLRDAGALVLPSSRSADKVAVTLKSLGQETALPVERLAVDATDDEALQGLIQWVEAEVGPIDILVNSQGIGMKTPTVEMTLADWHRIMAVNLVSMGRACQLVGARMIPRGRGHIINIASETSIRALPEVAAYGASKGGVRALTMQLATEWARHGIAVNAIAPGVFVTALNRPFFEQNPERLRKIKEATPTLGVGDEEFEDLRPVTLFLSTCTPYTNGQLIAVDGGMSIAAFTD